MHIQWPPDYTAEFVKRQKRLRKIMSSGDMRLGAFEFYAKNPITYIEHWGVTYDPRNAGTNLPTLMPFILFPKQKELVQAILACMHDQEGLLVEKTRDMGATWVCCNLSYWIWRFVDGSSVGWGSRKEILVDKLGDPDSIFEKIRTVIINTPRIFLPKGFIFNKHVGYMKIVNPENSSTITGEAGDSIGRGGRKSVYFKDESAHYERAESIEAALGDNTNVQVDISSVKGTTSVFARKRESGEIWEEGKVIPPGVTRVLVMDWRDHPAKTQTWYDRRREKAKRDGLLTLFAQEVDRDYAASVEGILIHPELVNAAIDAHKVLKLGNEGVNIAALDVADEGLDAHALSIRKGIILNYLEEWAYGDGGEAARKSVSLCRLKKVFSLNYDSIGVGTSVKSEINRMKKEKEKLGFHVLKWVASGAVLKPNEHLLRKMDGTPDEESPKNKDFFGNLKAQGWWQLMLRFERTYQMRYEGMKYPEDSLISIPSDLPGLHDLKKQLSQVTSTYDGKGRIIINKKPNGSKSPNKADSVMMNYWPVPVKVTSFSAISLTGKSTWSI